MTKHKLIIEISKLHPSFGVERGWSNYTGGMADTGCWDFTKLLESSEDDLRAFLESCKPKDNGGDRDVKNDPNDLSTFTRNAGLSFLYGDRKPNEGENTFKQPLNQ